MNEQIIADKKIKEWKKRAYDELSALAEVGKKAYEEDQHSTRGHIWLSHDEFKSILSLIRFVKEIRDFGEENKKSKQGGKT